MKRLTKATLMSAALLACTAGLAVAEDIKIGGTGPISGPQAFFGQFVFDGVGMYFDELNEAGGINGAMIEFERVDDKGNPREGNLVAQKLCDDEEVKAVIGPIVSGVVLASLPIFSDCTMPQVASASNPQITEMGAEYMVQAAPNDHAQGGLAAKYAIETLEAKTAAIVHDKQVFGQGVAEIFAADFEKMGGELVSSQAVVPTDIDFSTVITQLKSSNPDVVYLGAVMPQLALFAKQMRQQGLEADLIVPDGGYTGDFLTQAGAEGADGVSVTFPAPPADYSEEMVRVGEAFQARTGNASNPLVIYGYVYGQLIAEALKNAESMSREDVAASLKALDVETILGNFSFDETGKMNTAPMFMYRVQDNNFVLAQSND
jgi:branched-chain amino acid transport system substrate-binding protein